MSDYPNTVGPKRRVARTRGAASGILLVLLGAWGALIPFIGPYFDFSYTPDTAWTWTSARGWLEVLPGAATFVGGVLLLLSTSRAMTMLGAWLGIAGGAWFIVGPDLQRAWHIGSPGVPAGTSAGIHAAETLVMFSGLGAIILFLAAAAFGRLSVVSPRDVRAAERRQELAAREAEADAARDTAVAPQDVPARDGARNEPVPNDGAAARPAGNAAGNPAGNATAPGRANTAPPSDQAYAQQPYAQQPYETREAPAADPNRR